MVPITGRAISFLIFWSFQKQNREEGGTQQQTYQFTQLFKHFPRTTGAPPNPNLYHTQ